MRYAMILAAILGAACGSGTGPRREVPVEEKSVPVPATPVEVAKPAPSGELPEGEDILEQFLALNADSGGRPPVKFCKGHVSRRKPPRVVRTRSGFEIRFASKAPVVTPAVYDGKVY